MAVKPKTGGQSGSVGVGFSITLDSSDMQKKIARLSKFIDVRHLLDAIGNRHLQWMSENLDAAGLEKKHKIMAPRTIAVRPHRPSSHHFSSRFLSRVKQSLTKERGMMIEPRAVTVGTNVEYTPYQHFGTKTIPARTFLPSKELAQKLALGVIEGAYKKAISESGLS